MGLKKESKYITEYTAVCDFCGKTKTSQDVLEINKEYVRHEIWAADVSEDDPDESENLRYNREAWVSRLVCRTCAASERIYLGE